MSPNQRRLFKKEKLSMKLTVSQVRFQASRAILHDILTTKGLWQLNEKLPHFEKKNDM